MNSFTSVKKVGSLIVITRVTDNIEEFRRKFRQHIPNVNQPTRREPQQ
jgi:hypothetical protein